MRSNLQLLINKNPLYYKVNNTSGYTFFLLRREPFFHKLRYSKVPKFDLAAPTLGAISGAFAAYMVLSTLGSGGTDLSDLTTLVVYIGLWLTNLKLILSLNLEVKNSSIIYTVYELIFMGGVFIKSALRGCIGRFNMFFNPKLKPVKSHKNRSVVGYTYSLGSPEHVGHERPIGVYSRGYGLLSQSSLEKIFIRVKRILFSPRFSSRFWIPLQSAKYLTRKGPNVRMGKGKGKPGRLYATVTPLS